MQHAGGEVWPESRKAMQGLHLEVGRAGGEVTKQVFLAPSAESNAGRELAERVVPPTGDTC